MKGIPHCLHLFSPRFTSTLPTLDISLTGGAELIAELSQEDGFESNSSLLVKSHLGGRVKNQALILWRCDDVMITEPIVIETVVKRTIKHQSKWSWIIQGSVETVEPLMEQKKEFLRKLIFDGNQDDFVDKESKLVIHPSLHTRCGQGWERFYWIVYPISRDYHVTCINSVSLGCECDRYEEDSFRLGLFYLNKVAWHMKLLQADCKVLNNYVF